MKIRDLIEQFGFVLLTEFEDLDRQIDNVKCCDLLSWVMAKGRENDAWITVQVHSNILAVASLLDMSCIIIPEGIEVESEIVTKATVQKIAILSTELSAKDIFKKFLDAGL